MRTIIYCLHGFLGLPSDWDFLKEPREAEFEKVDVFKVLSPAIGASMMDWAKAFNEKVATQTCNERVRRILLGYSMGGRLALHCLAQNPTLWQDAVIVSANPTPLPEEREPRLAADEAWARRFETEAWETVVSAWENHSVFGGKPIPFTRKESDFQRADLAGAFRAWSLGRQEDLTHAISALEIPLLWMTGARDPRYHEIARRFQGYTADSPIEFVSIPEAVHRVPWEQPEAFESHFSGFLRRVFC